jgi:heptaprenyl diphosphate synthase
MLALMMVLSMLERMIPPLPFMPPSARLGLANVVVMYAALFLGWKEAFGLNAMKAVFVFLTRGYIAGLLSLSGGMLSVSVIMFVLWVSKDKASCILLSICSSIAHNLGQILAVSAIMGMWQLAYYLPFLLIFGVGLGIITGVILKVIMPAVSRGRWLG